MRGSLGYERWMAPHPGTSKTRSATHVFEIKSPNSGPAQCFVIASYVMGKACREQFPGCHRLLRRRLRPTDQALLQLRAAAQRTVAEFLLDLVDSVTELFLRF